jgi:Helix-turn-helix domain
VEDVAERAGMSMRHLIRAFMAETIATPSKAVERLRIDVAGQRVQSSCEANERIAETTGFRYPGRIRNAFIRAFGPAATIAAPRGPGILISAMPTRAAGPQNWTGRPIRCHNNMIPSHLVTMCDIS